MSCKKLPARSFVLLPFLTFLVLCLFSTSSTTYAAEANPTAFNLVTTSDQKNQSNSDTKIHQTFGIGLKLGGSHFGVGANVRYWSGKRVGFEVGYSRSSIGYGSSGLGYTASVNQIIPSLLLTISQADKPSCRIRSYIGGGVNFSRSSTEIDTSNLGLGNDKESSTNVGGQGFVGLELVFKKIPRLSFGGDAGYYSTAIPFTGMKIGGFALGLGIHFYLK
jgi:hypothetical protein